MVRNNAEFNLLVPVVQADDVTPYGLTGLTLELWVRPYVFGPVLLELSTLDDPPASRVEIIDDGHYLMVISVTDMATLAQGEYMFDVLNVTVPGSPQSMGALTFCVEQGSTEAPAL